ncbi:MAG: hypothetical protein C5B43_01980 [Verrucomicrobia bacterium]|nr:MAG: hypothetical protein C5B43_01980 [Verrucomicrobiota bacterium]
MAFFSKSNSTQTVFSKRKLYQKGELTFLNKLLDPNQILKILLFFAFSFFLVLICFVGQFPTGLQIFPNQTSKIRITSEFPFSYISTIQTNRRKELLAKQIAPIYSIDDKHFADFIAYFSEFATELDQLSDLLKTASKQEATSLLEATAKNYQEKTGEFISPDDISLLLSKTDSETRKKLFNEGLITLMSISREGIFKPFESTLENTNTENKPESYFYNIQIEGRDTKTKVLSEKDALRYLSLNINAMDIDWPVSRALFRILKPAIKPNLLYNETKTNEKIQKALDSISPTIVEVHAGQSIIEPGSFIGPEQVEQLHAYRNHLNLTENAELGFNISLREHTILTLVILFTALLYCRIILPETLQSNRRIALAAFLIVIQLSIIRLIFELGETEFFTRTPSALNIIPFALPLALAPMIIAIMVNVSLATVVAAITSTFYSLMLGSMTSFLLIALLASLIGIYFCRNIRQRSNIIRAGAFSGLAVALSAFLIGSFYNVSFNVIALQIVFAFIAAIITSIIIIGMIPILEKLFKLTTNITLLELTDFNHPLLRRLQLEAPGTYHHSLLVANLAERAASEIGANPLICRATSLYHDIGKLIKPEYFLENQAGLSNPHLERNPSMSALVIKSHVKEGVALARQYKLPKVIIDVIEQHHGTTLIKYFYDKALKQIRQTHLPFANNFVPDEISDVGDIEESRFRYEGPVFQFKESAIVGLADSVEAASRSLKKVNINTIKELIDSICNEKFYEHQMDQCPITFHEIELIKHTFAFTLLNMLHSRIEYPETNKPSPSDASSRRPN